MGSSKDGTTTMQRAIQTSAWVTQHFPKGRSLYITTSGNDANDGLSPETSKLTLAGAVAACTGADEYWIFISAGTYQFAADVDVNVDNVTIIGELGTTFDLQTYKLDLTGNYIEMKNIIFTDGYNIGNDYMLNIASSYGKVHDCVFNDVAIGAGAMTSAIRIASNFVKFYDNKFRQESTNPPTTVLDIRSNNFRVYDNTIKSPNATYGINVSQAGSDEGHIYDNRVHAGIPIAVTVSGADDSMISNNWCSFSTTCFMDANNPDQNRWVDNKSLSRFDNGTVSTLAQNTWYTILGRQNLGATPGAEGDNAWGGGTNAFEMATGKINIELPAGSAFEVRKTVYINNAYQSETTSFNAAGHIHEINFDYEKRIEIDVRTTDANTPDVEYDSVTLIHN